MSNNEQKMQHLEFIQNVITRMNTNSFQIKELTILIITACLAIYASEKISWILLVPVFPTFILSLLDSYYLLQERKFRALYNDVANIKKPPLVVQMKYEMSIKKYTADKSSKLSFLNTFFSATIYMFYLPLILLLIILFKIVTRN